ncbi:MAG: hypothetical protein ABL880_03720 [Methylotenera sp.]
MLVSRIIGNCPGCGGKDTYGNVSVRGDHILRGCLRCRYHNSVPLPTTKKKILYLDQFFFSGAFRGKDMRFTTAAQKIMSLCAKQLLVVPYSSVHEDETYQWTGNDGQSKDELMEFIKATSRGHEFEPAYDVERTQIINAFQHHLNGEEPEYLLNECEVVESAIHDWDDYIRIDVGRYMGDIELIRSLKTQSISSLVAIFDSWVSSQNNFEQDVTLEHQAAFKGYLDSYIEFVARIGGGDYSAMFNSPIVSMIVQAMLQCIPEDVPVEKRLKVVGEFFISQHFSQIPLQWLKARMFAVLKDMVKRGAFANREEALSIHSGFFYDVDHIATYAPYCDAFIMDKRMAEIVRDPRIALEEKFSVKIFSLNNWDELLAWLDSEEANITAEHWSGLSEAYP